MLDVGVKLNATPLQIVVCNCTAVFVITGVGSTVTVTSVVGPLQPLAAGVILYVTVPEVTPSVLVNTWPIVAPLPAKAPVTFVLEKTVQVYVVPATLVGVAAIATLDDVPLQMV